MSFSDYLMQLRIEKARELLLQSDSGVAELPDYSADHLILVNYESNWVDRDKSFASHPGWKKFAAVRKKQVYEVNRELFYGFDPLSLELQVQEIVKLVSSRLPSHL